LYGSYDDYRDDPRYVDNWVRREYSGMSRTLHLFYADGSELEIPADQVRMWFAKTSGGFTTIEAFTQGPQPPGTTPHPPRAGQLSDKIYPS
jgi:hypothetical protein